MDYTFILCHCNEHKERSTATPVVTFSKEEENKVLDYIKTHLSAFFDGTRQQINKKFRNFFKTTLDKNIVDAINSDLDIYAVVQQIPNL